MPLPDEPLHEEFNGNNGLYRVPETVFLRLLCLAAAFKAAVFFIEMHLKKQPYYVILYLNIVKELIL